VITSIQAMTKEGKGGEEKAENVLALGRSAATYSGQGEELHQSDVRKGEEGNHYINIHSFIVVGWGKGRGREKEKHLPPS